MRTNLQTYQTGRTESCPFLYPSLSQSCNPQPLLADAVSPKLIRILVLEDMVQLAELVREWLLLQGFEVEVVNDGATALQLLRNRYFDVALVDINLPDMSGFEVMARALASGCSRDTRVVFCTGHSPEDYLPQARQFPASSFISKPFTLSLIHI